MSEQQDTGTARSRRGRTQRWNPMGELQALRTDLARLVGGRPGPPEVELTETGDGWEVIARLPGVAPEEVAVELDGRELCVRARTEAEVNADQGIPGGMETRGFDYRLDLPSRVDPDGIDAVMDHGLLRIRLPRASRPTSRRIAVGRPATSAGPATPSRPGTGATSRPASSTRPGGPESTRRGGPESTKPGGPGQPTGHYSEVIDPAADRELHHPDVAVGVAETDTPSSTAGLSARPTSSAGTGIRPTSSASGTRPTSSPATEAGPASAAEPDRS